MAILKKMGSGGGGIKAAACLPESAKNKSCLAPSGTWSKNNTANTCMCQGDYDCSKAQQKVEK